MANSGLILRTQSAFSDTTLPKYKQDSILTDGDGSLFLMDSRTMSSGAPTAGTLFTNLAANKASALGIVGDTSGKFVQLGTLVSDGKGAVERSGKGGIHIIVTAAQTISSGSQGFRMQIPLNIVDYMVTNRTHTFYHSQWRQLTRAWASTGTSAPCYAGIEYGNSNRIMRMTANSGQDIGGFTGQRISPGRNTVGPTFENRCLVPPAGDTLVSSSFNSDTISRDLGQWGRVGQQNTSFTTGFASFILYRGYIEDLTVSGRTYAEVDALDKAMFDAAFASGGRFYNDTYTSPSTVS